MADLPSLCILQLDKSHIFHGSLLSEFLILPIPQIDTLILSLPVLYYVGTNSLGGLHRLLTVARDSKSALVPKLKRVVLEEKDQRRLLNLADAIRVRKASSCIIIP